MKALIGLGNPGPKYELTRHNAGFLILDQLAEMQKVGFSRWKERAEIGKGRLFEEPVILIKPISFMNLSGRSVSQVVNFFKIPEEDIIVIHDDIDVPLGKVKARVGGGSGGHKGIQSIIDETGFVNFHRIKLGVGKPEDGQAEVVDWVLDALSKEELELLAGDMFQSVLLRLRGIFSQKKISNEREE